MLYLMVYFRGVFYIQIADETDPETGVRHIVRLCRLDLDCPNWLKKMLGQYDITFRQESWIDPVRREMRLRSTNESWKGRLSVVENCRYFAAARHPLRRGYAFFFFFFFFFFFLASILFLRDLPFGVGVGLKVQP
jgi:hypothetical protein